MKSRSRRQPRPSTHASFLPRSSPLRLQFSQAALVIQTPPLGGRGGSRWHSAFFLLHDPDEELHELHLGRPSIAGLGPFPMSNDSQPSVTRQPRTQSGPDSPFVGLGYRATGLEIQQKRDPRFELVDVLTAGTG